MRLEARDSSAVALHNSAPPVRGPQKSVRSRENDGLCWQGRNCRTSFSQDIRLAKILANSGKPLEALKIVEDVLAKHPPQDPSAHAQLLHFRGVCLEATGNVPGVGCSYYNPRK